MRARARPGEVALARAELSEPASTLATGEAAEGKTRPRWMIFAVVSIALFISAIDGTIVATALSTLHTALHASIDWTAWTITAYQLGQMVMQPVAGRISDLLGRKRVFLVCSVLFTMSSLFCGLSDNIFMLIGFRFLQALGGGAFMPSAIGIVTDHFGNERDRAVGMLNSIFPIGFLIGPVLGGVLIEYSTWRAVFLVNVPIGLALIVLCARVLPTSQARRGDRPDLVGVGMLGICILTAMYAITALGDGARPSSVGFIVPLLVGVALLCGFVRRSKRVATPVLPSHILTTKAFAVMNLISLGIGAASLGVSSLIPLYAEKRYGLTSLQAGTLLAARGVGVLLVSIAAAVAIRRTGYRLPMMAGFFLLSFGILLVAHRPEFFGAYGWIALGSAFTGVGLGVSGPATSNVALAIAPEDAAAISGLRGMFRQAGGIVCISLITAVATSGSFLANY